MATTANVSPTPDGPAPPLYIDTQHEDMVHDVQLDFYGSKMATCSSGEFSRSCRRVTPVSVADGCLDIPIVTHHARVILLQLDRSYHQSLQCR